MLVDIRGYTGKPSHGAIQQFEEMKRNAVCRRATLESLEEQSNEGNIFAAQYLENMIEEREELLLESAELLHKVLQ